MFNFISMQPVFIYSKNTRPVHDEYERSLWADVDQIENVLSAVSYPVLVEHAR